VKDYLKFYRNKKVLVTGHTGFKGSWLTKWLSMVGAEVKGISLNPPSNPSHYKILNFDKKIISKKLDIKYFKGIKKEITTFKPDIIFHLAAQSLVKKSYYKTIDTFETNIMGTINILETLKSLKKCVCVIITSDKCYKNKEVKKGYKEIDELGGDDPYSASKASSEIIINSYYKTFFSNNINIKLCSVRAGNVIGGGDWADNRIVPDIVKAWNQKKVLVLRNPNATRPWQHVLEPINGYLLLGYKLTKNKRLNGETFNFGPSYSKNYTVIEIVKRFSLKFDKYKYKIKKNRGINETKLLKLNSKKSKKILNWKTILTKEETILLTLNWYKDYYTKNKIITESQIKFFMNKLK